MSVMLYVVSLYSAKLKKCQSIVQDHYVQYSPPIVPSHVAVHHVTCRMPDLYFAVYTLVYIALLDYVHINIPFILKMS